MLLIPVAVAIAESFAITMVVRGTVAVTVTCVQPYRPPVVCSTYEAVKHHLADRLPWRPHGNSSVQLNHLGDLDTSMGFHRHGRDSSISMAYMTAARWEDIGKAVFSKHGFRTHSSPKPTRQLAAEISA